ncbi:uncharacterized protein LOC108670375 [Hyalella azteca]|uniref:Uncharacterized protein LOC108670375 n=1 Tax=Hyalella azteca TaxID=294128 RepID=A0A8B7NI73_HYAAZ|nr:uncharacterized protein LOC108670375 [Hyalella azteca]
MGTAEVVAWCLLVSWLPASVVGVWSHRYDLLSYYDYRIAYPNETSPVSSPRSCRTLCVFDEGCSASSATPSDKRGEFECRVSRVAEAHRTISPHSDSVAFIKERKPKLFFWSDNKDFTPSGFSDLCSSKGGKLGIISTIQDIEYIKKNIMAEVDDQGGFFIPLVGKKVNGTAYRVRWLDVEHGVDTYHPLNLFFSDSSSFNGQICHKISPQNGLTLRRLDCGSGSKQKLLCYKYQD